MPAAYAHQDFGQNVYLKLDESHQNIISKHRDLYNTGVQGPDFMFYHVAITSNAINKYGSELHHEAGREFFSERVTDDEKGLAYMYGVLTHYALDSTVHPYVGWLVHNTKYSHTIIETEFDRFLLQDKVPYPWQYRRYQHVKASRDNAKVIAGFYPRMTDKEILLCLKSFRFLGWLIYLNNPVKESIIINTMKLFHVSYFKPYAMTKEPADMPKEYLKMLYSAYQKAIPAACELIAAYDDRDFDKECFTSTFTPKPASLTAEEMALLQVKQ